MLYKVRSNFRAFVHCHDISRWNVKRISGGILVLGLGFGLAACAAPTAVRTNFDATLDETERQNQYEQNITTYLEDSQRLTALAYGLRRSNGETCGGGAEYGYGFTLANIINFSRSSQETAKRMIPGLGPQPQIIAQAPDGASATGGLKMGDRIMAVAGRDVQSGRWAMDDIKWRLAAAAETGGNVDITVARGDESVTATLAPELVCAAQIRYVAQDPSINAYTDGIDIFVTSGMMNFAQSDDELVQVLAHEMAHRALGHVDSKNASTLGDAGRGLARDFASILGRVNAGGTVSEIKDGVTTWSFTQAFESDADTAALTMLTEAGHDISGAAEFWQRIGAQDPDQVAFALTHPTTEDRILALTALDQ